MPIQPFQTMTRICAGVSLLGLGTAIFLGASNLKNNQKVDRNTPEPAKPSCELAENSARTFQKMEDRTKTQINCANLTRECNDLLGELKIIAPDIDKVCRRLSDICLK